jgi:hypothetical protein
MTDASQLEPSPTWRKLAASIGREFHKGVPFQNIHEMNIVIQQGTFEPYERHRRRLDELLWHDDPEPKTVIDLGAGYGAMATFWPNGSRVFNLDLFEMLQVQAAYLAQRGFVHDGAGQAGERFVHRERDIDIELVPIDDADKVPLEDAYLFSVWALTETTRATWAYWIERAPRLAGAYLLGYKKWVDETQRWPWQEMADAFQHQRGFWEVEPDSYELAAVNR